MTTCYNHSKVTAEGEIENDTDTDSSSNDSTPDTVFKLFGTNRVRRRHYRLIILHVCTSKYYQDEGFFDQFYIDCRDLDPALVELPMASNNTTVWTHFLGNISGNIQIQKQRAQTNLNSQHQNQPAVRLRAYRGDFYSITPPPKQTSPSYTTKDCPDAKVSCGSLNSTVLLSNNFIS